MTKNTRTLIKPYNVWINKDSNFSYFVLGQKQNNEWTLVYSCRNIDVANEALSNLVAHQYTHLARGETYKNLKVIGVH